MSTNIDPLKLTVDDVFAAAERRGLRITTTCGWVDRRTTGQLECCPLSVVVLDANPTILGIEDFNRLFDAVTSLTWGLPRGFRRGVMEGFDGNALPTPLYAFAENKENFNIGHALGTACRQRALAQTQETTP